MSYENLRLKTRAANAYRAITGERRSSSTIRSEFHSTSYRTLPATRNRFDQAGFDRAMGAARTRSRLLERRSQANRQSRSTSNSQNRRSKATARRVRTGARFSPSSTTAQGAQELKPGEEGEIILDHTPFYAESGGQVGDRGWFYSDDHNTVVAEVKGCYYPVQGVRAHRVIAKQPHPGRRQS